MNESNYSGYPSVSRHFHFKVNFKTILVGNITNSTLNEILRELGRFRILMITQNGKNMVRHRNYTKEDQGIFIFNVYIVMHAR